MKVNTIISNISKLENISIKTLTDYIKSYEKLIKSEIKNYKDKSGLDDYKMSKIDYEILYELYMKTSNSPYKIHILLLFMYSFYKLDNIHFDINYFPTKLFFKFLENNDNIHNLIFKLITK